MRMKTGQSYVPKLQTYLIFYGIEGYNNVNSDVYDQLYYVKNDQIMFNTTINMSDNKIVGLAQSTEDDSAVNLTQLTGNITLLRIQLLDKINLLQSKSYYEEIFEYFYKLTDPNTFEMDNTYGSNIKSIGGKLMLQNTVSLTDYDSKQGFSIDRSHIKLDDILDQNSDFTLFISFLHDSSYTGQDYYVGLGNNANPNFVVHFKPYIIMRNDKFLMRSTTYALDYEEDILSVCRNKHLSFWFCKQGNNYKAIICQGGHINETIVPNNFQANRIVIQLPYKVQRIGFSKIFYNIYEKEFHKISSLEKANGTFFI